jgi:hypothetical protein
VSGSPPSQEPSGLRDKVILDVTWASAEERLKEIGEGREPNTSKERHDQILADLGLIDRNGLTAAGDRLYMAKFVTQDREAAGEALADVLKRQPVVHALLEALWPVGSAPVSGAVNMLKRLTKHPNEQHARRWLNVLNQAGLVAYNRNNPKMRVLFNPAELLPPEEEQERERERAHVISRDTPYGNLLALRELLRAARGAIRWWEQHMPVKVLEVLYRELDGETVKTVRLLSGPENITNEAKDDFKRFRKEMKDRRAIDVQWRVLSRREAFRHHDRFFITEAMSRNLPPLNSILAGSTGEILPSDVTEDAFDGWWELGTDLVEFVLDESA